jgi:hypothetical protein
LCPDHGLNRPMSAQSEGVKILRVAGPIWAISLTNSTIPR